MSWFTACTSDSLYVFPSLVLLYKATRQCRWYTASWAIKSLTLNLASSCLSYNFIAHCQALKSSWNVNAFDSDSPDVAGLSQKKHTSIKLLSLCNSWRVNLLPQYSLLDQFSMGAFLFWARSNFFVVLESTRIMPFGFVLSKCCHHHSIERDLLYLVSNQLH